MFDLRTGQGQKRLAKADPASGLIASIGRYSEGEGFFEKQA